MGTNQIVLPPDWLKRCYLFGKVSARDYIDRKKERSRFYATRGIESDPVRQATAKMAECGLALWLGLPIEAINWERMVDDGTDIVWHSVTIDVKKTELTERHRRLVWSNTKGLAVLRRHSFDLFVMVKVGPPICQMVGWVSRVDFLQQHKVATADDPIDEGSLYMMQEELCGMDTLGCF